jgi:flavoprotein
LTRAPDGMVKVFPRRIDLENTEKLKAFEATQVAESLSELKAFIAERRSDLKVA